MNKLDEIVGKIQAFAAARNEILAVYLFGSVLVRKNPADIDIALVLRRQHVEEDRSPYGYMAGVTSDLMELLRRNEVDVILMHEASPLLCKEVLRKGKLVYSDPGYERVRSEKKMMDRYIDTAPLRRIKEFYLKRRYLGHD